MTEHSLAKDAWSSISTELLQAELIRRAGDDDGGAATRPVCGSGKRGTRRTSKSVRPSNIIFYSQHFGTGVLIATAFVHLLPTAFVSLTDPCLPPFFNKAYTPLAGLIAMAFAISVVWIESTLTTRGAGHSHAHHMWEQLDGDDTSPEAASSFARADSVVRGRRSGSRTETGIAARRHGGYHRPDNIALADASASDGLIAGASPLPELTPPIPGPNSNGNGNGLLKTNLNSRDDESGNYDDDEDDDDDDQLALHMDELDPVSSHNHSRVPGGGGDGSGEPVAPHLPNEEERKRLLLQCMLLEAGILFHSIFIGMALSVATGPAFVVFLIAIAFHQCFEGLALGSRIAAIHFPLASAYQPWLMVLAYGTTTPLGQAIGLLVHNLYDPQSQTGLLTVGIMNAVSSGLLLFAGLVQLLAEDFLTEKSYKTLRGGRRNRAFLAVVSGASLMALVGAFA
ncbi:zip family zinc transporter [Niveomyces insectorum RCEF 264]|uniref:Zip family zinc transporter n=1 Tax=Niveomyces insectorum RCEF 264 TaxID=1081102 RepID=A0A167VPQ2_9HYPO|nr:zip family zinc transporter [Niveomyces insectorum RCEF 264]